MRHGTDLFAQTAVASLITLSACSGAPSHVADAASDAFALDDAADDIDAAVEPYDAGQWMPRPQVPWEPPFDVDPVAGWGDSVGSFCNDWVAYVDAASIVADDDGVRLLVSTGNEVCLGCGGTEDRWSQIVENDGAGWRVRFASEDLPGTTLATSMVGFDGGRLWLEGGDCPLSILEVGAATPTCIADPDYPVSYLHRVMPYGVAQAHAVSENPVAPVERVVRIDDRAYTELLAIMAPTQVIAADPTGVLGLRSGGAVGDVELFWSDYGGEFISLGEVFQYPAAHLESSSSVWVVHDRTRVSHYDGSAWRTTDTGVPLGAQFWIDGDDAYIAGETSLVRASSDGAFAVIASWDPDTSPRPPVIVGIDGSHLRHEVYLLLREPDFVNRVCGAAVVLVYDGARLRRF